VTVKTLREVDEDHSPKVFASKWGHVVKDIIDISHDDPVYDARGLERESIRYAQSNIFPRFTSPRDSLTLM
jgi:hypothetical protein